MWPQKHTNIYYSCDYIPNTISVNHYHPLTHVCIYTEHRYYLCTEVVALWQCLWHTKVQGKTDYKARAWHWHPTPTDNQTQQLEQQGTMLVEWSKMQIRIQIVRLMQYFGEQKKFSEKSGLQLGSNHSWIPDFSVDLFLSTKYCISSNPELHHNTVVCGSTKYFSSPRYWTHTEYMLYNARFVWRLR